MPQLHKEAGLNLAGKMLCYFPDRYGSRKSEAIINCSYIQNRLVVIIVYQQSKFRFSLLEIKNMFDGNSMNGWSIKDASDL